jgi:hypothetical protein
MSTVSKVVWKRKKAEREREREVKKAPSVGGGL